MNDTATPTLGQRLLDATPAGQLKARLRWYAGRWPKKDLSVYAWRVRAEFPVEPKELARLLEAVEAERQSWTHRDDWREKQRAKGRLGGKRSGEIRRARTYPLHRRIVELHVKGLSQRAIAAEVGKSRGCVRKHLKRAGY